MFQHFLANARKNYAENVYASMQLILTLASYESKDITTIIIVSLTSLRREKWDTSSKTPTLPINVVIHCAKKLITNNKRSYFQLC
jgi:hypothetical protein